MPYIYQCPYCNHRKTIPSGELHSYGSPLKECVRCKKIYLDPYCEELALTPYRPYSTAKLLLRNLFLSVAPALAASAVGLFAAASEAVAWICMGVGLAISWILLSAHSLLTREKIEQQHRNAWNESDRRLKQGEYAALLANLDYNVPFRYLPSDFKYSSATELYKKAKVKGF